MSLDLQDTVFAAVLLDMDGTLVDSTAAIARCWTRWADEHGVPPEALHGWHGIPAASLVQQLLPAERRDSALRRIDELEVADVEGVVALPGALPALAALAGAPHAIVTSCTMPLARARMTGAGLTAPEVLVTADQVRRGKPAPDPYLLAADRLGVDPARCLVVEDAPLGLEAARAAGCATLAVVTTTPRGLLVADAVVDDLSAVTFEVGPDGVTVASSWNTIASPAPHDLG